MAVAVEAFAAALTNWPVGIHEAIGDGGRVTEPDATRENQFGRSVAVQVCIVARPHACSQIHAAAVGKVDPMLALDPFHFPDAAAGELAAPVRRRRASCRCSLCGAHPAHRTTPVR